MSRLLTSYLLHAVRGHRLRTAVQLALEDHLKVVPDNLISKPVAIYEPVINGVRLYFRIGWYPPAKLWKLSWSNFGTPSYMGHGDYLGSEDACCRRLLQLVDKEITGRDKKSR